MNVQNKTLLSHSKCHQKSREGFGNVRLLDFKHNIDSLLITSINIYSS
jgi:hypothetical protein